ncbi:hypothetical protein ACP70R_009190 [Stipagrostis hirtigluma subsp. patula]
MDGDLDCDGLGECLCQCAGVCCELGCLACLELDDSCCSHDCVCCTIMALGCVALVAAAVALVVTAFVIVTPVRVTVDDASLGRLELLSGGGGGGNGTSSQLAYDLALAVAVRNRGWALSVRRTALLDAELRFRGQTFARVRAADVDRAWIDVGEKEVYRVAAAADRSAPLQLGSDGVAEFVRESVAGVFELELAINGEVKYEAHRRRHSVSVICPLRLSPSTATAPAAFTRVKCTRA